MTFRYNVSAFDGNFSLFMHPSSNASSKFGLDDAIWDKNYYVGGGGCNKNVIV